MNSTSVRRVTRTTSVALGVALGFLAAPAFADAPTTWEPTDNGSFLDALLVLVGVPLAIVAVIALLTYLPGMIRSQPSTGALAFQEKPEWFGGPRQGAEAAEQAEPAATETGGASARW